MSSGTETVVITQSPLSHAYLARLAGALGEAPQLLEVKRLRALGAAGALRALRQIRAARLVVPLEEESAGYLLPLLQILAATTRARRLCVANADCQLEPFTRWSVLPRIAQFALSVAANFIDAAAAAARLAWLQRRPRRRYSPPALRRVLYINGNLWFGVRAGGSIGHVAGVINALVRRGYEVRSAACTPAALLDPHAQHVPLRPQRVLAVPIEFNNYRYHHRATRQLTRYLRRTPIGFIYQRLSLGNFTGLLLARRQRLPLVTEYNGSEVWAQQHWGRPLLWPRLATRAEDVMLRQSHLVVTISEVLRRELIGRGIEPQRIVTYPNCIDPAVFDPARFNAAACAELRARFGIAPQALVATFVGTFGRWHGVDVLAHTIRRLLDAEPQFLEHAQLHFLLVGDGMKMPEVREILSHPLAARFVTLAGLVPQQEAPLYLAASDLLLSPHVPNPDGSRFFGSPTKLFEYMAMGKAIIASDLDQIGEVLADSLRVSALPGAPPAAQESHVALLCRPGDSADLIGALKFLAAEPAWRERLGSNVRATALAHYTWDRHVAEILNGLDRVASLEAGASAVSRAAVRERGV